MKYRAVWRLTAGSALFLDRDGVLNRCVETGFVRQPADFEFLPGVLPALARAACTRPGNVFTAPWLMRDY